MCLRIYLNGDGTGRGSHLSLFFVVMRGQSDALLKWPFNQKVKEPEENSSVFCVHFLLICVHFCKFMDLNQIWQYHWKPWGAALHPIYKIYL